MVGAFFIGRGYGEKTYLESEDYKKMVNVREELDFAKNEFENAKVKLQNIIDNGEKAKTDELLAQILQVFLADLGLRIQNKEAILKQAQFKPSSPPSVQTTDVAQTPVLTYSTLTTQSANAQIEKIKKQEQEKEKNLRKIKSEEWLLLNSGYSSTRLERVTIKNLKELLKESNLVKADCQDFAGEFRGDLKDVSGNMMGSLLFKLTFEVNYFSGKISWLNDPNPPLYSNFNNSCGLKVEGLAARFFNLTENVYLQIYNPIADKNILVGNLYEILQAGTTKKVGSFRIRRR